MPLPIGALIGLGSSIFGGLFGRAAAKARERAINEERARLNQLRQTAIAERGETRGGALGAYRDIYAQQGYTPEEAEAQRVSAGTRGQVELTPERAQMIRNLALAPIGRAAEAAQEEGLRRAAVHGNYAPGLNATLEEIARERGRQTAEQSLAAELGIYREGAGQALALSDRDRAAAEAIANARRQDRALAAGGFTNLAGLDTSRLGELDRQIGSNLGLYAGQPSGMEAFTNQIGQGISQYGVPGVPGFGPTSDTFSGPPAQPANAVSANLGTIIPGMKTMTARTAARPITAEESATPTPTMGGTAAAEPQRGTYFRRMAQRRYGYRPQYGYGSAAA